MGEVFGALASSVVGSSALVKTGRYFLELQSFASEILVVKRGISGPVRKKGCRAEARHPF